MRFAALVAIALCGPAAAQGPEVAPEPPLETAPRRLPGVTPGPTPRPPAEAPSYRPAPQPRPGAAPRPEAATRAPTPLAEGAEPRATQAQPQPRPARPASPEPGASTTEQDATAAREPPDDACLQELQRLAEATRAASPPVDDPADKDACRVADPVRLTAVKVRGGSVVLTGTPVLSCPFALSLARWTRDIAAPLARGELGQRLTHLATGPGFQCRRRNRRSTGRLSEHALGNAVDISAFRLAPLPEGDAAPGRIPVAPYSTLPPRSVRYLHATRRAACGYFTTILGPGSDAAHARHLHFDRGRLFRNGKRRRHPYRICD